MPEITSSLSVLKHTWRSGAARPGFLSPDSREEARTAAGLGTSPFPPPLPLLPLLAIEAKSGSCSRHVVANAAGNAFVLPTLRRTWSRPRSKTPDFASIVSNGSNGEGEGEVPRPAAVGASTLLSGERKTGLAAPERQVCLSTNNNEVIIGTHASNIRYTPRCHHSLGLPPRGVFFFSVARFAAEALFFSRGDLLALTGGAVPEQEVA